MNFAELVNFDVWTAVIIFLADFVFWFLSAIWVRRVNGNKIIVAGFFAMTVNMSEFISKFFAPWHFINIIPAGLGALTGSIAAMWYDNRRKQKLKDKLVVVKNIVSMK